MCTPFHIYEALPMFSMDICNLICDFAEPWKEKYYRVLLHIPRMVERYKDKCDDSYFLQRLTFKKPNEQLAAFHWGWGNVIDERLRKRRRITQ